VLRLAVVGAGIMGASHARVSVGLNGATVVSVVDPDLPRASAIAGLIGARAVASVDEILADIDAAIVATPSDLHLPVGLALIEAGKHVLIEKPLATTVADAERLVDAASRTRITLMTGHVERFNAAVLELDRLIDNPVHISASRISPYSSRVGTGVVLDLMIHDLDIVASLARSPVAEVAAVARRLRSDTEDLCSAVLRFENGVTADLTASRIGQQKIRTLAVTQTDNFVSVDLVRQDVTINRVDHSEYVSTEGARYRQTGMVEIPFLEFRGEPLLLEQQEFVRAVTTDSEPRVTGAQAIEALLLAHRVLAAAGAY